LNPHVVLKSTSDVKNYKALGGISLYHKYISATARAGYKRVEVAEPNKPVDIRN